jgi:hypothetical protein
MGLPLPMVPQLPAGKIYGLLARFPDTASIYHACEKVRDAGFTKWDSHTPFPVHGLDKAMGLKASKLPWLVLTTGLSGATGGMLLQYWVAVHAYPLVISGKPLFSWPAFVPVTFELGVLFGALGAVFGMFAFNQLPMLFHPLFSSRSFAASTDDGFFISIESWDPKYDETRTAVLLREAGAIEVEVVDNE